MQSDSNYAPIVLFVYNRPWHTRQTVEALQKNKLANASDLFVFSDTPKSDKEIEKVSEVRNYIQTVKGFKKVEIIEQKENQGLAKSIIAGVTQIVNQYGKIIVLEDDLVTSPYFLTYMNDALSFYEKEKKVWHISGWNYPASIESPDDVFFFRVMNCWGWGTWSDRWNSFEKNTEDLIHKMTAEKIKKFNLDGYYDFWGQVVDNKRKKIDTWAIYWYATIFNSKGLCLNPVSGFTQNIGLDGSGIHCKDTPKMEHSFLNQKEKVNFLIEIKESTKVVNQLKNYFYKNEKNSFFKKIKRKMINSKFLFTLLFKPIKRYLFKKDAVNIRKFVSFKKNKKDLD